MMTIGALGITNPSLAAMITYCSIEICRESLHERFTAEAVTFMRKSLEFVFKQKIQVHETINIKLLSYFQNVYIIDSSSWGIDPRLKNVFPGFGGSASKASCKIQLGYEYLRGIISLFELTKGTHPDNKYTINLPGFLQKNDLILFDLGYFSLNTFLEIGQKAAYFLSRFIHNTALYNPMTLKRINILEMLRNAGNILEIDVLMGSHKKTRISCRLVAIRVSEEIASKRKRSLKERGRRKGFQPSAQAQEMCNWTIMVTNIPMEKLPVEMVLSLYSLRWQIEVLFKQIKSQLNIDKIDTSKEYRIRCEIIGRIIMAILFHRIHSDLNIRIWNTKHREVSMEKLYKRLGERTQMMIHLIKRKGFHAFIDYLKKELTYLLQFCLKGIQKNRRNIMELLEEGPVNKYLVTIDCLN